MRLLLGIILGVFLTIGFAYVYDASTTHSSELTVQSSMINGQWSIGTLLAETGVAGPFSIRSTWNKLASR